MFSWKLKISNYFEKNGLRFSKKYRKKKLILLYRLIIMHLRRYKVNPKCQERGLSLLMRLKKLIESDQDQLEEKLKR